MKDGLARVAQALNQVEAVEPPADLRKSILSALPKRHAAATAFRRRSFWAKLPALKYGYVLAAGLILGFVLHPILFTGKSGVPATEVRGSMVPRNQLTLSSEGISGSIGLRTSESFPSLDFDLSAQKQVQLEIGFDAGQVEFKGFNQQINNIASFTLNPGRIIVQCQGKQRFSMQLTNLRGMDSDLTIGVFITGKMVQTGTVRLPKSGY